MTSTRREQFRAPAPFVLAAAPRTQPPSYNTAPAFLFDPVHYLLDNPEVLAVSGATGSLPPVALISTNPVEGQRFAPMGALQQEDAERQSDHGDRPCEPAV